jgi:serine/threonine protein kinase
LLTCPTCVNTSVPEGSRYCPDCGIDIHVALDVGSELHGTYRIEGVMGRGGFGITYKGLHRDFDIQVAIKEFFPAGAVRHGSNITNIELAEKQMLIREGRILAKLKANSIVGVRDVFEENNTVYLVMDLVEGTSLGNLIIEQGGIDDAQALDLIVQVAEALKVVHDAGILHQDVKPDNLILTPNRRVVLVDFGSADRFSVGQVGRYVPAVTPGYSAPEQYGVEVTRGSSTDIYGLAATFYALLVGEAPPPAIHIDARHKRLIHDRRTDPSLPKLKSSPTVSETIRRAMSFKMSERPQSIDEFLDMILSGPISELPEAISKMLWSNQLQAIKTIKRYMQEAQGSGEKKPQSALIHMPTGSGKTGVIAVASHLLEGVGCVLILSPRIGLREQLSRELATEASETEELEAGTVGRGFFEKLDITINDGKFFTKTGDEIQGITPKNVCHANNGFPSIADDEFNGTIIVMTIQMLHGIERESRKLMQSPNASMTTFEVLKEHVGLVIVDEGHYEPAVTWCDAIRALEKPKVIFTATPFRNDLKLFDVDYTHSYSYSFSQAVKDHVIRDVVFEQCERPRSPREFVEQVLKAYQTHFGAATGDNAPRVIIRCATTASIRQIGQALAESNQTYVLIHETFQQNDKRPFERQSVPNPNREKAVFWVHQFKLLEGIDDPRFQMLALYEPLQTARAFVQQVGRILRNPGRQPNTKAYVLDHTNGEQKEMWDNFLVYDDRVTRVGLSAVDFADKLLSLMQAEAQPIYIDGRFRPALDVTIPVDPQKELKLPLSTNVFVKRSNGRILQDLHEDILIAFKNEDRMVYETNFDSTDTLVYVFFTTRNSPLLRHKSFLELRLGVTIVREVGSYLCYFDSNGGSTSAVAKYAKPVSSTGLRKLFAASAKSTLTEVSLRNAVVGPRVIRSRTVSAAKMADILPGFDEHSFVCRTAKGYRGKVRRYVGFGNGRVTDAQRGVTLDDYLSWLDGIAKTLRSNTKPVDDFARYALPADLPEDPTPRNILLDLADVQDIFIVNPPNKDLPDPAASPGPTPDPEPTQVLMIEDACADVVNGGFTLNANGMKIAVQIKFDAQNLEYHLESPELETQYIAQDKRFQSGLVRYLNNSQSFRVVPQSEGSFYTLGQFYNPILRFGPKYDDRQFGLLSILHETPLVEKFGSEKGKKCLTPNGWDHESLFALIDCFGQHDHASYGVDKQLQDLFVDPPDILVCDDLGMEAADFILANRKKKKVVFIHAKGRTETTKDIAEGKVVKAGFGASDIQVVCAQATKNLKYFSRYGDQTPPNSKKWSERKWTTAGVDGSVASLVRVNKTKAEDGSQLWREIKSIIQDPLGNLEVWLFLGKTLSKSKLQKALKRENSPAAAQQTAYLLFSTMNDAASVGAKLKVICSP